MRNFAICAALASAAACTGAPIDRVNLPLVAEPSRVIATELAFARAAREDGTWTAFRKYSTRDAIMPDPGFVRVQDALRGLADPAEPILWGPDQVWSSCDGSFAVSTGGALYPSGRKARFVTVWQKQADGEYRWVLDQGFPDDTAQVAPETIGAAVAQCPEGPKPRWLDVRRGAAWSSSKSNDGTLAWNTQLQADCARTLTVHTLQSGEMREVFRSKAPAPPVASGQPAPTCN